MCPDKFHPTQQTKYPLKIILAVHHFPPTFKGGAEWRAHRTAKWLQKQGHNIKVICIESANDANTTDLRWVDEKFGTLKVRRLFLNMPNSPDPIKWEYSNPWIEAHLTQYLAEEKPDIFHLISGYLMTASAITAAKNLDIPVVLTLTDFWFLCPRHTLQRTSGQVCIENTPLDCTRCSFEKKRRYKLPAQKAPVLTNIFWQKTRPFQIIAKHSVEVAKRSKVLKTALNQVEVAICPSNFLRQIYIDKGFEARTMRFLRQGLAHIPSHPITKSPSAQLRIGYIGQIAPHKGIHVLVEAFLKLKQTPRLAQLKLYGDTMQFPGYYHKLQDMVTNKKQVQFLGTFDNHKITQIYEELDILVVPSVWYENSPNVILEAFAHQTPVIASNLGGMAELITEKKTGLLFAPNEANDLAVKLETILNTTALLSNKKKDIVSSTTLETEMSELSKIYQSVLKNKQHGLN